jgi:putative sterol carrier protein
MARFLSAEWLRDVDAAMAAQPAQADDGKLVLQQVVIGGPDGDVTYAVDIDSGVARVRPGRAPDPDVTITEDYDTAAAIHRGELTLQDAFMTGQVRVAGNMATLIAGQSALIALEPLPATLMPATTY